MPRKPASKKLTGKRAAFVREYLKDFNATQAAIRSGYSEHTAKVQGSRLLTFADVKAAIEAAQAKTAARSEVTIDRVVSEYEKIAFAEVPEKKKSDRLLFSAKMRAKMSSLEALGKHLGMFIEKLDVKLQGHIEELLDAVKPYMSKQAHAEFRTAVRAEMGLRGMAPPGGENGGGAPASGTDSGGQLH